jgi:KaiC/GvpD/RAD55 family RecA-like ATPase
MLEIMASDFFLGFTAHAHTMNELETDQKKELELRRRNSPEEAEKLIGLILDKLEKDLLDRGYSVDDVKLLILYLSYRGESAEKDTVICESILRAIENRFKKHAANQLRLIGHTTGGELENEDLVLKEISGIGYNGLSLLALVTNLPIGVGRTWGLKTAEEAGEQGREMARDAWIDFNQQTMSKEHLHMRKTLLVLTQGSKVDTPGYEHFLAEGIAHFMGSTREARIINVIGGSSGDGVTAKLCRQFYGRLREHPQLKVLDGEAVCVLIPNLCETSTGLDVNAITKIGRQHTFHFNSKKVPHYKYVKRIGNKDAFTKYADVVYAHEVKVAKEKGLPMPDKETIMEAARLSREQKRLLIFNPVVAKYAFAFPFGNYVCAAGARVVEEDIELMFPIRSYIPEMPGYIMMGDHKKVQRGARRVYDMLREDQGFCRNDATFLVSCINRRIVELMAGCRAGTEAEILKEGLSSTQVIGFLAYGELSFTNLLQEPYAYAFSCWGMTLRSKTNGKEAHKRVEPVTIEVSKVLPGRISTGYENLDSLLFGGIPENYAVVLTSPSCDERDLLIEKFLEKGTEKAEVTFYVTTDPGEVKTLTEKFQSNFYLFICNPQADRIIKSLPNVFKLKGVENLTEINITLTSAFRRLDKSLEGPRRACIEIISDSLLQHHAVQTRRWLNALIPELKSNGFTTLAVMDPEMHSPQEVSAILDVFEGEISIYDKETKKGLEKFLKVKKMYNRKYSKSELPLHEEKLQK